jgi:hypothetical protein
MLPVDANTGNQVAALTPGAINEAFRLDASGRMDDTQYRIVSAEEVATSYSTREDAPIDQPPGFPYYGNGQYGGGQGNRGYPQPAFPNFRRGLFGSWTNEEQDRQPQRRDRRVDPDYFFWHRMN